MHVSDVSKQVRPKEESRMLAQFVGKVNKNGGTPDTPVAISMPSSLPTKNCAHLL